MAAEPSRLPAPSPTAERTSTPTSCSPTPRSCSGEVADADFTADQIGNGAKELLDEVATGKVTGEEEVWSHTDLCDFQANVDGARSRFEVLEPGAERDGPASSPSADHRASPTLQTLLDQHRRRRRLRRLRPTDRRRRSRQLSDAVNALSEPLSKLTAAVASDA